MPNAPGEPQPAYEERLRVPHWWWPVAFALGAFLGAQIFAGFGWVGALVTYAVIAADIVAGLFLLGRTRVVVRGDELVAGRVHIPLSRVTGVRVLEGEALRLRMGRDANAHAVLVTRPWMHSAIELATGAGGTEPPYWLVSTRRPAELAAVVRQACGAPSQHGSM